MSSSNSNSNSNNDSLLKYGCSSIILGKGHYGDYFPEKPGKLMKVTKVFPKHDELKHISAIKKIANYENYYVIPDEEGFALKPDNPFYIYLKNKVSLNIFKDVLYCHYVNNAGSMDMIDAIENMTNYKSKDVWYSFASILQFAKYIVEGLYYLHEYKICHLDIKPENIMIDMSKPEDKRFRIIDFGFSSVEPFTDYINDIRGTPGYFPKYIKGYSDPEPGLPLITANDLIGGLFIGNIPMRKDYKQVYKIDSYCFGRTLNHLLYYYQETFGCGAKSLCRFYGTETNVRRKIESLITALTKDNAFDRLFISEVRKTFFKK